MTFEDGPVGDVGAVEGGRWRGVDAESARTMDRWIGNGVEHGEQRESVHRLAEALRRVADELVRVDAEAADVDQLLPLEDLADRLRHGVTDLPQVEGTPAAAPLPVSHLAERSPVTGAANPAAPPLRVRFGQTTVAHAIYGERHEGPVGGVHGGVVAASFDEVLGIAQMASGSAGYTGSLQVRYHAVTPLHTLVTFEAGVERVEGRRLHVWATATADGTRCAEATGVFVVNQHLPSPEEQP